jgi:acyl dehydratase
LNEKYFEDYDVGQRIKVDESYEVTKVEIIDFAKKWDPQPIHMDEAAAKNSQFGGLIAAGCHTISIAIFLVYRSQAVPKLIAALGWDEIRFPNPVRPGAQLSLTLECIEKRESKSKPDRGIVRNLLSLSNQQGETVFTFIDTIIVSKRNP